MANKKWEFLVAYVDPADFGEVPSKRGEIDVVVSATSVSRALSIARKGFLEEFASIRATARDFLPVECVRTNSPFVATWAGSDEEEEE
jgi:hypothetical protein